MLKWAVGQRPSTASSTCSEITSGVACCPSTFSKNTVTLQSSTNRSTTIRTAYVRNLKTANKENRRKCKRSLETEMVKPGTSASARNRDSIYMHLDSIPAALRDVSNHWSPGGGENSADCATKPNKRRHVRLKKSPCKVASHKFNEIFVHPVHIITESSNPKDEMKKDIDCESSDVVHVTQSQMFKELIETKKQPCKGSHTFPANSHNPPILAATELNRSSMLIENPVYFTVQTSPPEEPDELFHKELPVKRCRPMLNSCDNQNQNQNRCSLPLVFSNDDSICDIASNTCEMSTLTTGLSWLKLNARKDTSRLHLLNISSPSGVINADKEFDNVEQSPCNSSLEIINSNSAVFSDDNQSNLSLNTISSNRSKLKRKFTNENLTYVISTANETKVPETIEKIKSKRRCVVFSEQSFTLSTPPVSEDEIRSQYSSFGMPSIDLDKPSTLTRQKVIRRKNKRISTVPQSIYNKNLKSWLTLPNGIPSPFEVNETNFKILSRTPMTTLENRVSDTLCNNDTSAFSIMRKAVSTPKQDCPFNLTEDVFLSPGVRPLLDSVIIQSSSDNTTAMNSKPKKEEDEKLAVQDEDENYHPLSVSELTWNSHGKHLPKTVNQNRNNDIDSSTNSMQSSNSSRINDDQDVFSSIVSSTPTLASSPMTTKDRQHPRSRRCLSFVSPTTSRSVTKQSRYETGQLDLRIYYNNGLLTVHIIRAKNLQKIVGNSPCNAYVKVNLVPQGPAKSFHRTCVRKNSLNPKFDHKFSMEISESDLSKRVLISAWHRDRWKQKSEFLGCMSFAVKNILRKDINGSYKLLPQISNKSYASQILHSQDLMANQTLNTVEEQIHSEEVDRLNVPAGNDTSISVDKLKSMTITKKEMNKVHEEYLFLQHLELDPIRTQKDADGKVSGRTPFTTTHRLLRQPNGSYGFSIAWTHPPRVERVEANLPADVAGLKPGDNVIFVNKTNVVTLSEQKILDIIKNGGNQLVLEIYRKPVTNGTVANKVQCISTINDQQQALRRPSTKIKYCEPVADNNNTDSRSTTAYSTATGTTTAAAVVSTTETSKKRLQLPQITFSSEDKPKEAENARQHFVYELLEKEQQYALCLQFGISRFLLPLAERRDVIRPSEHQILFQNVQELLRITEDILERMILEEGELFGRSIGKIYMKKFSAINSAYRRYCCGLKKADCILVEKTRCGEFMKLVTDPPIPKKRPDLISFIHKPLEHYRDILKILQSIANCKESKELDHHILSKLISEMQTTYRNITVESGLMDCGSEGRPILSLQDLESRLVFTKCKPFTLNTPGRKWIFAGDLNRVEGKSTRLFWALLFSDILLFTKINRDKVVFVTEEPLLLASVVETQFYIKKRDTEFRLLIRYGLQGNKVSGFSSPSQHGCVPLSHFHSPLAKRVPKSKDVRRRTLVFRAPSSELKAVWQNLIQRQVIKINTTGQGITPASSPVESPNQLTTDSLGTADTSSTVCKRQCDGPINDIIEHKCYMLGKSTSKEKAFHLAQWMRGELDRNENSHIWSEPEIEIWSKEMLQQRTQYLDINFNHQDNLSTVTQVDLLSTHSSKSSNSPTNIERRLLNNEHKEHKLCKKCHQTCLQFGPQNSTDHNKNIDMQINEDAFLDCNRGLSDVSVPMLLSPVEPFNPMPIHPGTPQLITSQKILNDDEIRLSPQVQLQNEENSKELHLVKRNHFSSVGTQVNEEDSDISDGNMPCKSLQKNVGNGSLLKRYASFSNLNVTTDNEDIVDHEPPQNMIKIENEQDVSTRIQSMMTWANRATTFVTQQVALFEKIGENVQNSTLFDSFKYLRPTRDIELTSTSQTLAFEEDYENSGGTSGDEFWGTPNSSNEAAALSPSSSHDDEEDNNELQIIEEILLNRTTAMLTQQHNITPSRMLQNKFRLETLPEDEEEYNTRSSSASTVSSLATSLTASECTLSCSVPIKSAEHNSVVNNNLHTSFNEHSSSVFTKTKLRKSVSMENSDTEFEEVDTSGQFINDPKHYFS